MPDALKLQSLPLFPLGTVLFPGGLLPLQIFEVRYLDMIAKAYKAGAPFGVVLLSQGTEVRKPDTAPAPNAGTFAPEVFQQVGTLASITHFENPQAGLILIQCVGTQRFEVTRSERLRHGLWIADVRCREADYTVDIPADLQGAANALQQLIENIKQRNPQANASPVQEPYRFNDSGWVANRWCELLPIPPDLRQKLMSLDNPLVRLELVSDILQTTGIA
jgi:Lon protease-like protein